MMSSMRSSSRVKTFTGKLIKALNRADNIFRRLITFLKELFGFLWECV